MKKITLLLLSLLLAAGSYAQSVGINSDGSAPDASAMLDVKSSNKGFLPPRVYDPAGSISSPAGGLLVYKDDGTADNPAGFYYYNGAAWTRLDDVWTKNAAGINYSGNVGIGTTAPGHKFTVAGQGPANTALLALDITGTGDGWFNWASSAIAPNLPVDYNLIHMIGKAESEKNSGYIGFNFKESGSDANFLTFGLFAKDNIMNITGAGYVGIGTTTPGAKLHIAGFGHGVAGGITMSPVNNIEGGHFMTFLNTSSEWIGSIARGAGDNILYNSSSDYRLKENVVNISANQAKSRLMSLRPVEYNYISDENKTVISGFLAHEMAEAGFANGVTGEKDAVDKDGNPIYQAIDTKFLIPEMVKVIQEQQTEIEALKKELEEIKKVLQYKK